MAERRKLIASPGARAAAAKAGLSVAPLTREARLDAMRDELRKRFPQVFARPDVPLAVGIKHQIFAVIPHSHKTLRYLLHAWTQTPSYLTAIAAGEVRRNLDGSSAGHPTAVERASAGETIRRKAADADV